MIKSKAFIGSILFAASLWGYTSLNHEYTPFVKVPLSVKLPADKARESPLPETIALKVKGGGWQLFYLIFFNSAAKCVIDLSNKDIPEDEYIVSRSDILKGIQNIVDVEPIDVLPESMKLKMGRKSTYKVPVNPIISIKPREGFVAMSDIRVSPDSIEITGNDKIVRNIKLWNTKKMDIENIFQPTVIPLQLSDSLKSIVKLSQPNVNLSIDIQQTADITIYDIPVRIRGGSLPKNHKIIPEKIDVTIHGGVEQIAGISKQDIISYIEYEELLKDSTGVIKPTIVVNEDVSKYYAYPKFIYHLKQMRTLN
ncbi:CdaR family protein [Bacteroidota bacterium]